MENVLWRGHKHQRKIIVFRRQKPLYHHNVSGARKKNSASIISIYRKSWYLDIIRDLFNERDQQAILHTRLEDNITHDMLYWKYEQTGLYSVRSAHKMMQDQKGNWVSQKNHDIWKLLWRIKTPPKTSNLVWRALTGCLPTMVQLYQKHVPVNTMCHVCKEGNETIFHVLVTCRFATQC